MIPPAQWRSCRIGRNTCGKRRPIAGWCPLKDPVTNTVKREYDTVQIHIIGRIEIYGPVVVGGARVAISAVVRKPSGDISIRRRSRRHRQRRTTARHAFGTSGCTDNAAIHVAVVVSVSQVRQDERTTGRAAHIAERTGARLLLLPLVGQCGGLSGRRRNAERRRATGSGLV